MRTFVLLLLLQAATSLPDDASTGTYLKLNLPDGWANEPSFVLLADQGDKVSVKDLRTGRTTQGSKIGDKVEWQFNGQKMSVKKGRGNLWTDAIFEPTQGQTMLIHATKLTSVWVCSNHQNPTHCASSEDEMRQQTEKNQCLGWHKL